jgi:hypothetical protein
MEYIHDRSRTVGFLRKKYAKEANVFRIKLPKDQFLRRDHSIDLNKARQALVCELTRIIGNLRDFNGGMISKQNERLCSVREQLLDMPKYNELLLENFFYSLTPDVMRTVLDPKIMKDLFLLMIESIEQGVINDENYALKINTHPHCVLAVIKTENRSMKELIGRALGKFDIPSSKLATSFVLVTDVSYLGYLYMCDEPDRQQFFSESLQSSLLELK